MATKGVNLCNVCCLLLYVTTAVLAGWVLCAGTRRWNGIASWSTCFAVIGLDLDYMWGLDSGRLTQRASLLKRIPCILLWSSWVFTIRMNFHWPCLGCQTKASLVSRGLTVTPLAVPLFFRTRLRIMAFLYYLMDQSDPVLGDATSNATKQTWTTFGDFGA